MSIFSSIKKIFKKVVKTIKKVAPFVLLAAAVVFTAGAALAAAGAAAGALGTAAAAGTGIFGWSTALSAAIGGPAGILAGSPILASVITGAVTQGIIGTAIGGALALATGKDITKGMLLGGITGLVTGGVTGFITAPPAGLPTPGTGQPAPGIAGTDAATGAQGAADVAGRAPIEASITRVAPAPTTGPRLPATNLQAGLSAQDIISAPATQGVAGQTSVAGQASVVGQASVLRTGLDPTININVGGAAEQIPWDQLDALGRLSRVLDNTVNTRLGSAAVVGGVTALLTGDDESGRVESARIDAETARLEREATAQNFGGTSGFLTQKTTQQFVPNLSAPLQGGRWFWNPETRRLDYQQAQTA